MNIILLGPPGAGKGTQAASIAAAYSMPHISTGEIFRRAAAEGTELGLKAKGFMDRGELVPDEVVIGIVLERLLESDCDNGFLLDGFPRTIPQARELDAALANKGKEIDIALNITVDRDELVRRLTGRRVCRRCGAPYHVESKQPRTADSCDNCAGELYQRDDDSEESVGNRLRVYDEQTAPLVSYYGQTGRLHDIDGAREIQEVSAQIAGIIASRQRV